MTSGIPALPGLADLSPLGQGGLADVYLARQIHLERWVAAKVFRVSLSDEQAADRFRAECRALGRIDQYPDIITVYDAGVLPDGRPYLISERCEGSIGDLVDADGPLPDDRVAMIGLTVARALRFAHSAGVLHGDVTPQNVLLRSSGAPVLADFGLAVLRDHRARTAAGFTMAHAAPEAFEAGGPIDETADVYGLGSTLYATLTGHPPFPRYPGEDDRDRLDRIRTEPVEPPPGRLGGLLVAMLAKHPAQRPSTDEVVDALGGEPAGDTTHWIPAATQTDATTWMPPAPAPAAGMTRSPATASGERTRLQSAAPVGADDRSGNRRWAPIAVGALVVLVLAIGGAAFAWSRSSEPQAPALAPPSSSATAPAPPSPSASPPSTSSEPTTTRAPRTTTQRRTSTRSAESPPRTNPPSTDPQRPPASTSDRPDPTGAADPTAPPTQDPAAPQQRSVPQQQNPGGDGAGPRTANGLSAPSAGAAGPTGGS